MTEIPANTPNPIGNTSSFLPGRSNGVVEAEASAWAAVALMDVETPLEVAVGAWSGAAEAVTLEVGRGEADLVSRPISLAGPSVI